MGCFPTHQRSNAVKNVFVPHAFFIQDDSGLRHLDRDLILLVTKIGEGQFEVVYRGEMEACEYKYIYIYSRKQ